MADDQSAPEAAPEDPTAEVGAAAPDPSMEVAAGDTPDVSDVEAGTAPVDSEAPSGPLDPTSHQVVPSEAHQEAEAEAEAEDEDEDDEPESTPAEDQANFVPPPPLDQAGYVQGLMVASSNAGQDQRRESLARNRERRRLQHEAIAKSNQG